jgi:hypothetical protein
MILMSTGMAGQAEGPMGSRTMQGDPPDRILYYGSCIGPQRSSAVDILTVKYGADGQRLDRRVYAGPGGSDDYSMRVVTGGAGNICVGGSVGWSNSWNAYAILEYSDNTVGVSEEDQQTPPASRYCRTIPIHSTRKRR